MSKLHNDNLFDYYVINLDSSVLRWQRIQAHFQHYNIFANRISAIYGEKLSSEEIDKFYTTELNRAQFFMPLKPAEIGCFISHIQALKQFLQHSEKPYAVILEDDVEFIDNPSIYFEQWLSAVQTDEPVMLKLYSRRRIKGTVVHSQKSFKQNTHNNYLPYLVPLGCQAAVFNLAAAKELLSTWQKFGMPVDVAYQYWWKHGVKVMVTVPNHIREISQELGGSNISINKQKSFNYKAWREIKRSWYRFLLSIKSRCYYWLRY